MSWQSTPLVGLRMSGSFAGRSANATGGASSASSARIVKQVERGRRAAGDASSAARRDGATLPTWLETSFSRRLWNAPPSGTVTSFAPYQVSSSTVASSPASRSAVASPAADALVWNTRSQSSGAASGAAKAAPSVARDRGRATDRCRPPSPRARHPRAEPRHQQPDHAGADHRDAVRPARRRRPRWR